MGKLFKYEWKKQMFSKIVIACVLLALTALYSVGMLFEKENWQAIAMVLLIFVGIFAAIYVGIESLLVLNRDLKTKESHMLFMVPQPAWKILTAKILASICLILLTIALFAAAFIACFSVYLAANDGFAQFLQILQQMMHDMLEIEISWQQITLIFATIFISWISTIAAGFLSIISVRTVLVKSKLATLIAVVVFFVISGGMSWLTSKIMNLSTGANTDVRYFGMTLVVNAVITAILLVLSGWMAEKKLSV